MKAAADIEAIATMLAGEFKVPLSAVMGAAAYLGLQQPEAVRRLLAGSKHLDRLREQLGNAGVRGPLVKTVELEPQPRRKK